MKTFGLAVLIMLAILGFMWGTTWNDLALRAVFAPRQEAIRRETFEGSKAYRDGMIQELRAMQFEYQKADYKQKAGMANVIRHKLAGFPEDAIPSDLQVFIKELP